jgi:hypothetical protein
MTVMYACKQSYKTEQESKDTLHTCMSLHIHVFRCSCLHACEYISCKSGTLHVSDPYRCQCMHAFMHTCIHAYILHAQGCVQTQNTKYMQTRKLACHSSVQSLLQQTMQMNTNARTHAWVHTYIKPIMSTISNIGAIHHHTRTHVFAQICKHTCNTHALPITAARVCMYAHIFT